MPRSLPVTLAQNTLSTWSSLRTELVWIYEGAIHPLNRHRRTDHTHGYWVWLMRNGSAEVRHQGRVLRAGAGECLVSPHGIVEQDFSEDATLLSVHFSCHWPNGDLLFCERDGAVFALTEHPDFANAAQVLSDRVTRLVPPASDIHFAQQPIGYPAFLRLNREFTEWLLRFADTMTQLGFTYSIQERVDERLHHAIQCLQETSLGEPFPLALIQRESGLGRSQLDRLFLQSYGMTTRSYWAGRKLQTAKALLATTVTPVKELGFRLGFKQASHFTKWFQLQTGLTPTAYRSRELPAEPEGRRENRAQGARG